MGEGICIICLLGGHMHASEVAIWLNGVIVQ